MRDRQSAYGRSAVSGTEAVSTKNAAGRTHPGIACSSRATRDGERANRCDYGNAGTCSKTLTYARDGRAEANSGSRRCEQPKFGEVLGASWKRISLRLQGCNAS